MSADLETRTLSFVRSNGGGAVRVTADVVLAADGANSSVRAALLKKPGFELFQKYSRTQYKELPIPAPEVGWPLEPGFLHVWPRGDQLLVAFPNTDRSMTCSLFAPMYGPGSFEALNTPAQLVAFFEDRCPELLALMPTVVEDYFARPPSSLVTTRCSPWVHDGWLALVGDAAHSMVPFLGQGLNAGLEDCAALASCLDAAAGAWSVALPQYEQARRRSCDILSELSELHYIELAERARDPRFVVEKALEQKINRLAPDRFIPFYNMVTFLDTTPVEAERIRSFQRTLLAELMRLPHIEDIWDSPQVEREILRLLGESS
jgi:kynurenine 3-monooxygenase